MLRERVGRRNALELAVVGATFGFAPAMALKHDSSIDAGGAMLHNKPPTGSCVKC